MIDTAVISAMEAVLFASGDPVPAERIGKALGIHEDEVHEAAILLMRTYEERGAGIRLVKLNNSYQLHSAAEYSDLISRVLEVRRPSALSVSAMEVLSIVAYYQPVTRAYIEKMRGVDSSYTVSSLLDRGLIEPCGQLDTVGRPTIFRTTDLFLRSAGLTSLEELPPLPVAVENPLITELEGQISLFSTQTE